MIVRLKGVKKVRAKGETYYYHRATMTRLPSLSTSFFQLLRRLREQGKVGAGLSFHGLRHTLGTALAEAGCDPPTIAAVLGQATTQMAEHYSRTANRRGLVSAAMKKMENQTENRQQSH